MDAAGGALSTKDAYAGVAEQIGLPDEFRKERAVGADCLAFDRSVRWARQKSLLKGLLAAPERGMWEITGAGRSALRQTRPGVVVTLYESESGIALWADCRDAFARVESETVSAIITSPPYPLLRPKDYGNLAAVEYVEWLTDLAAGWKRLLRADGSLVLNLGDCWERGRPTQSLYAERLLIRLCDDLGYRLAQRFEWYNPAKLPAPAEWVTVRRVRVKPSLERVLWLSKSDHPFANNREVQTPYSGSMKRLLASGGEVAARRPSGHDFQDRAFGVNNGGAIPSNLITASNTSSNSSYQRACRAAGLPVHPARFPSRLPEFFINFLTKPGDLVADPFGGSFKTAAAAEKLGRRFITCEKILDYGLGGALRLSGNVKADGAIPPSRL